MHDSESTFKLRVNLVQVRVVVRDSAGKPVENLHREDFEIYDQGKLQAITNFEIERLQIRQVQASAPKSQETTPASSKDGKVTVPERFVALVFDDIHLSLEDAMRVRDAASKVLVGIVPDDRVAVYCTSGECPRQEFTSDLELLNKAVAGILPHAQIGPVSDGHVPQTNYGGPAPVPTSDDSAAELANRMVYAHLTEILQRLSAMPGQRILVFVSPGFAPDLRSISGLAKAMSEVSSIVDSANRSGIVINTLDARGFYSSGHLNASVSPTDHPVTGPTIGESVGAEFESSTVLQDLAAGTGGTFFQNSNDLAGGVTRLGSTPELSYMLGFSPQNQRTNGQFHLLRVRLAGDLKYDVQARRGYFVPNRVDDPKEKASAEMEEAIYSQREIEDFPLEMQTQCFTAGDSKLHLSVVSHLGIKGMRFRKSEDRNLNNLTIATAVFDENGNLVDGAVKHVEMRLLDATYAQLSLRGLTVKTSFELHGGKYMVRQVVRDSEGSQMAAQNGVVSIEQAVSDNSALAVLSPDSSKTSATPAVPKTSSHTDRRGWLPPDVDANTPPVEPDSSCNLDVVLREAGYRIQELVDNVQRFTATESLLHEAINERGDVAWSERRKYDYIVAIQEFQPGSYGVEEFLRSGSAKIDYPGGKEATGLPALILIFHPFYAGDFAMTCEGAGLLNGKKVWQVYFRQKTDKPNRIRSYRIGNGPGHPVDLKGRAWFQADNYQIASLQTDLVRPLPEIQLIADHTVIEYAPIHFAARGVDMWLPQTAEVYSDWKGKRFHRRLVFSDFFLFAVEERQKISIPTPTP